MSNKTLAFRLSFALSACILVASSALGAEPQWVEVRSPNFSVVTDTGEKRGREVAMRFEQMRGVFGALMSKADVHIPVPLQIVAFRNTKEMRQFAPLWNGKPTEVAGLFQSGEDRSFIMLDMSIENPWNVVFHEYAHQLMNGISGDQLDPWFEEGFAEYFSSIEVDNKQARVGKVPDYEYAILRQQGMMKVTDLFRVQQQTATYNESGDHRNVFYAESGIVVHYLYDNQWIPKLSTYFDLIYNKNVPVPDAIQQTFGMSAAKFDKELSAYVFSGLYKFYVIPTPPNIVSSGYEVKAMSSGDAAAVMADIHFHTLDYRAKAIGEFEEILKTDPNNATACRGLGYASMLQHDYAKATDYFGRSLAADPNDARAHYYYGLMLSQQKGFGDQDVLIEITKEATAAITLDPKFADPYNLLAFAQCYSGNPKQGLQTIDQAIVLNPRNVNFRVNLARVYMNNRDFDKAIAILSGLKSVQDPRFEAEIAQTINQAQQGKMMLSANSPRAVAIQSDPSSTESSSDGAGEKSAPEESASAATPTIGNTGAAKFLKGKITAVDCSSPPAAVLTVVSGTETWKFKVSDTRHAIVIGADDFSCAWKQQSAAVNFRPTAANEGYVISVEVQ